MPSEGAPRGRILVVEDEDYVRDSLTGLLEAWGFEVMAEASVGAALQRVRRVPLDAVLSDMRLGDTDGIDLVRSLRSSSPDLPVIILTGHGTIASAVECIRAGASDYILKPADPDALEVALDRALAARELRREVGHLRGLGEHPEAGDPPVGRSPAWQATMDRVRAAGGTDSTVLLLGESGTGKELLARLLHRLSPRSERVYVRVNCAAVPLEMWESEFFGHRRGSFTGATADREGRFLLAHRGTIFIDEVGTMPLAAQAKILRALEEGEFQRLGDERPTRVDVRVVAATNSDLQAEVAAGRFRQDLFYRLNVVPIRVPPLRERIEDIPLLVAHLVASLSARLGRPVPRIADDVLRDLMAYSWPGNVRELRNVLERALILGPGEVLASLDLPPVEDLSVVGAPAGGTEGLNLRGALARTERGILVEALRRAQGVRKEAARLLGIDQRNLPYYLRKHGIDADEASG